MLLAIDIGNTNINLGVFEDGKLKEKGNHLTDLEWKKNNCIDWLDEFLTSFRFKKEDIKSVIVASVVPVLTGKFREATLAKFGFEPIEVNSHLPLGIKIDFDNPEEIGADRLANAVAMNHFFPGQSVIAVDFGTAITFDIIDEKKGYIGGVVAPGIGMVEQALCEKTALLPQVEVVKPTNVFGRNTEDSIKAGIYYGMVGLVKLILDNLIKTFDGRIKVIGTGGWAHLIAGEISEIEKVEPNLTLYGLWKINELNRGS